MNERIEYEFRECSEADVDLVIQIGKETFFDTFSEMNTAANLENYLGKAFDRKTVAAEIKNPGSRFYLFYYNSKLIGYLKINEKDAQTEFRDDLGLELERLYIKKDHQGEGLGKVLINKGIAIAREKRMDYVWLGVWEKNIKAIRFYEKMGFKKYGVHDFYLGNERQIDFLMIKEIV